MIQIEKKPRRVLAALAAASEAAAAFRDPSERMGDELQRLLGLIDDALPASAVSEIWSKAEKDARAIIAHLVQFEGARYTETPCNGTLFGLKLASITASSTSSPIVLLRNWQRNARRQIEALA